MKKLRFAFLDKFKRAGARKETDNLNKYNDVLVDYNMSIFYNSKNNEYQLVICYEAPRSFPTAEMAYNFAISKIFST